MQNPQLTIMTMGMSVLMQQAVDSGNEQFKTQAFYRLALWMLSQFTTTPALQTLQATSVYLTRNFPEEQLLELSHHVKFAATGADIGLNEPDAQSTLAHEIVPLPFLGQGAFSLQRDTDLVSEFIAALDQDDIELCESLVHRLATRMVPSLGLLRVVHRLNSFM